jgi:hypothetical protein
VTKREPEPPARNDPVKRRWMIVGGTIVALAAGGGAGANVAAAADEAGKSGTAKVVRIDGPHGRQPAAAATDDKAPGSGAGDASSASGSSDGSTESAPAGPETLANRLGRFMG